jgi:hypothetical protein
MSTRLSDGAPRDWGSFEWAVSKDGLTRCRNEGQLREAALT